MSEIGKIEGDDKYRFYLNIDKIKDPLDIVYIQLKEVGAKKINENEYDYHISKNKAESILKFIF